MSFAALNYDFSQLPKVRSHAQLGRLGDPGGCSIYDPTSYGTCATFIIQGRTELADAHNAILDLANYWQAAIQNIQQWPDSQSKADALAIAQDSAQQAIALVQQHTQVQNEYEDAISAYTNIGLAGLWKSRGGTAGLWDGSPQQLSGLGVLPWVIIIGASLVVSTLVVWGITSALALKANYESQSAYYNSFTNYYQTCQQLAAQGKPCNITPPSSTGPSGALASSAVTWAILLGLGALVIFNISTRR